MLTYVRGGGDRTRRELGVSGGLRRCDLERTAIAAPPRSRVAMVVVRIGLQADNLVDVGGRVYLVAAIVLGLVRAALAVALAEISDLRIGKHVAVRQI